MISLEEAKTISESEIYYRPAYKVFDLQKWWLVCHYYGKESPPPGLQLSTLINKQTGHEEHYFPPDWKGIKPSPKNLSWKYDGDLEELLENHKTANIA